MLQRECIFRMLQRECTLEPGLWCRCGQKQRSERIHAGPCGAPPDGGAPHLNPCEPATLPQFAQMWSSTLFCSCAPMPLTARAHFTPGREARSTRQSWRTAGAVLWSMPDWAQDMTAARWILSMGGCRITVMQTGFARDCCWLSQAGIRIRARLLLSSTKGPLEARIGCCARLLLPIRGCHGHLGVHCFFRVGRVLSPKPAGLCLASERTLGCVDSRSLCEGQGRQMRLREDCSVVLGSAVPGSDWAWTPVWEDTRLAVAPALCVTACSTCSAVVLASCHDAHCVACADSHRNHMLRSTTFRHKQG